MRVQRREVAHSDRWFARVLILLKIFLIVLHFYLMLVMVNRINHVSWRFYFVRRTWRPINWMHTFLLPTTTHISDRLLRQIPLPNLFVRSKWRQKLRLSSFVAFFDVRLHMIVEFRIRVVLQILVVALRGH